MLFARRSERCRGHRRLDLLECLAGSTGTMIDFKSVIQIDKELFIECDDDDECISD